MVMSEDIDLSYQVWKYQVGHGYCHRGTDATICQGGGKKVYVRPILAQRRLARERDLWVFRRIPKRRNSNCLSVMVIEHVLSIHFDSSSALRFWLGPTKSIIDTNSFPSIHTATEDTTCWRRTRLHCVSREVLAPSDSMRTHYNIKYGTSSWYQRSQLRSGWK